MQQPFDNDQASEAGDPLENRLRSMEASIAELRRLRSMDAPIVVELGQTISNHIRNAGRVGQVVEKTAHVVEEAALEVKKSNARIDQIIKFFRGVPLEAEYARTNSELAQPAPERGMAERSRKNAETVRLRKDLLTYGLPLLGIVVAAFAFLPLRLPLAWVALVYIVLILGGGSLAGAWVVSAFRELLKHPRRQQ